MIEDEITLDTPVSKFPAGNRFKGGQHGYQTLRDFVGCSASKLNKLRNIGHESIMEKLLEKFGESLDFDMERLKKYKKVSEIEGKICRLTLKRLDIENQINSLQVDLEEERRIYENELTKPLKDGDFRN